MAMRLVAKSSTIGASAPPDVRPLSRLLDREVDWEEAAHAISDAARPWAACWNAIDDEADLIAEAEMTAPRFRDPAWTWQR